MLRGELYSIDRMMTERLNNDPNLKDWDLAEVPLNRSTFQNATVPAHPFVTNLYQPHRLELARLPQAESQRLWQETGAAGRISCGYVLVTVVLASALFCGGAASRFESLLMRRTVLALGLLAFAFAGQRLVSLPVEL